MTTLDADKQVSREEESDEADLPPARELCWVGALLGLLLLLFFSTPILRHEVLSPADLLLKSQPWRQSTPPDFEAANSLLSDFVYQYRPRRVFTNASLKGGRLPLWDPHNYAGAPFLGNGETAVLYPPNLLFLVFPEATAVILWATLRLFIAGLSAYIFGRVIGLSVLGAGMSSLGFVFSGFLVVWLLWPHVNVAIWLPALFLAGEMIIRRPIMSRILAMGAIVCIQFLGGHPETSLHILSAVTLYVCWRAGTIFREERDWWRLGHRFAAFAGALILGTAGAAVQLLPLGEYILVSTTPSERLALAPPLWSLQRPRLLAMIALVCPYCFGSHLRGDLPLGFLLGIGNFNELNGAYVGLVSLLLAGIAVAIGARRKPDLFFLVLGGLAFCLAYAIPPVFNLIYALPLFRVSANTRSLLILAFAISVLAGRGTDLLMAAPEAQAQRILKRTLRILMAGMAGVAIVTGFLLIATLSFREKILEEAKARIVAKAGKGTFQQSPDHYLALLPRSYDRLVRLLVRQGTGRVALLALTGLAISLAVRPVRGRRPLSLILPGVLILDLFSFGRNYNPVIPKELDFPSHGIIEFLQKQPGLFRILALNGGLPPNTNVFYGLSEVRGYSALETEAYHRFLAAAGHFPQPVGHFRSLYFSNFESRLIDLLNVKYLISDRELRHPKLTLVWEAGGAHVYENLSVLPRGFLVYRTRVLSDKRDMDRALRDPAFDPQAVVLLDREGPALSGPVFDPAPMIRIVDYQPERVVIEVSSRYDGILVLGDAWFPGWEAAVDGIPTKIFRANVLLRAVPIPAGNHQVLFRYDPLSFRLGVTVSVLALIVAISLGLAGPLLRTQHDQKRP